MKCVKCGEREWDGSRTTGRSVVFTMKYRPAMEKYPGGGIGVILPEDLLITCSRCGYEFSIPCVDDKDGK